MKTLILAVCILLPALVSSAVQNETETKTVSSQELISANSLLGTSPLSLDGSIFDIIYKIFTNSLDITINPSQFPNYLGLLFTTDQMNSLFPLMKGINPARDVSLHIGMPLNVYNIYDWGYHFGVKLHARVDVIYPDTSFYYTTFTLDGYARVKIVTVGSSIRLSVEDYQVEGVSVTTAEAPKLDIDAILYFANSFGQLGVDYGNYLLGTKLFSSSLSNSNSATDDTPKTVYQDNYIEINTTKQPSSYEDKVAARQLLEEQLDQEADNSTNNTAIDSNTDAVSDVDVDGDTETTTTASTDIGTDNNTNDATTTTTNSNVNASTERVIVSRANHPQGKREETVTFLDKLLEKTREKIEAKAE